MVAVNVISFVVAIVLAVLAYVWLHNISLNTYRTYKDIEEIKELLNASKTEKPQ